MILALLVLSRAAIAQSPASAPRHETEAHAIFLSDIHLEAFYDPGKVAALRAAPVERWKEILSAPGSADQAQRFDALRSACPSRGTDTPWALFSSSLHAMHADTQDAGFVLISGDLVAHEFICKYKKLYPENNADDYRLFVEKTIDFVLESVRQEFPGIPVYAALGNNDSDCDDYRLDAGSDFLRHESSSFTSDVPEATRKAAGDSFSEDGNYAVYLPAPLEHARLLVLDDLFMSRKYASCGGKEDAAPGQRGIMWLRRELNEARESHEKVWVMAHIPPGIDPVSTVLKMRNVCASQTPEMFLSSSALPETLAEYADVVELAVFGHTHMDEMRLLTARKGVPPGRDIPVKLVPSISPVDGNTPSFTVATIDDRTARLKDYQVFAASNTTGSDTTWSPEYQYGEAYRKASFSSSDVDQLVMRFRLDPEGRSRESEQYLKSYFVSDRSLELRMFWPQYSCAFANYTVEAYRGCVCAEGKAAPAR